jgi:NAD(P)H-nitrite reductase large subunit
MRTEIVKTKYLLIGNSAGGIGAAEAIRSVDNIGSLTIVSDEPYPVYSRPMISEYLAQHADLPRMLYRPADFYEKKQVTTVFGKKVIKLDIDNHLVEMQSGETIAWEKLLLATGGTPIVSNIEGWPKDRQFSFTTLDDAKAIDRFLDSHKIGTTRVVVIGGGLIGFSVTEALVKRKASVTIIEMKDRVLNTIVDEETSRLAAEALRNAGVEIVTNHTVSRAMLNLDGSCSGVVLDDGRQIDCDLVVMAIGVRPRLDLVAGTAVKTNRGILVDRHMMTSHPDVYACGDVAEAFDFVYSSNRLSPIWPNAYIGGRIAGLNMAGHPADYAGGTAMNSLKYFGLAIASAGITVPPDATYETIDRKFDHSNRRIVIKDGIIQGMALCGDVDKSGVIFGLMRDRVDVSEFKKLLVLSEFSLASLPESIWRERLGIVPAGFAASAAQEVEEEDAGGE